MHTLTLEDPALVDLPVAPPARIRRPVMVHRWDHLSFVHWLYPPEAIAPLLPPGLQPDTFDGASWVGVIPFLLTIQVPGLPRVPWVCTFPEVNVRTYVRGPEGGRGIWFFSLDAARLGAVAAARGWYHLPYMWARTRVEVGTGVVRYDSRRRWPSPKRPRLSLALSVRDPIDPLELTKLERFLTCRWRLYSMVPGGLAATDVDHDPWPLRRAGLVNLHQDLLGAAGLPEPMDPPLLYFSPGVRAAFSRRRLVGPSP